MLVYDISEMSLFQAVDQNALQPKFGAPTINPFFYRNGPKSLKSQPVTSRSISEMMRGREILRRVQRVLGIEGSDGGHYQAIGHIIA
jgi:hypothetical protein